MFNKPLIVYHFPCDDGYASALAAWLKFGNDAEYCGRDHNDSIETLPVFTGRDVYILDFSFKADVMAKIYNDAKKVVWLDHHKTSFELCKGEDYLTPECQQYSSKFNINGNIDGNIEILLDNTKSGCILSWQHFFPGEPIPSMFKFIDDIDRWAHRIPDSIAFSHFLRSNEYDFDVWHDILMLETDLDRFERAVRIGRTLETSFNKMAYDICDKGKQPALLKSNLGLVCNAPYAFASGVGNMLAKESGTFGMTWFCRTDGSVSCSLRSIGDFDVSVIAKTMGGGGHKNASGFTTDIDTLKSILYFN